MKLFKTVKAFMARRSKLEKFGLLSLLFIFEINAGLAFAFTALDF